jgi:hypothetical protein
MRKQLNITLEDKDLQEIKDYCAKQDIKISALLRRSALNKIKKEVAENESA